MNRLAGQPSPYLQAHADNPIDWFAWGPEAFEEAKHRDVPVLISIGYHTCHWCHVMARESFSDPDIGELVNQTMVAIKVDREEHPDVDSHYLTQAGAFIEQLGWPLTIFATPEGDAFHAATYLPPTPRGDVPSFRNTIEAVNQAWRQTRDQVEDGARRLREAIAQADAEAKKREPLAINQETWRKVIDHIASQEDTEHGGLGTAPKFPIAPVLTFLLSSAEAPAIQLAQRTLTAIAQSPLRDSIDGGFFRYATQRDWTEPHYERMLYDNAQLLWLYATSGQLDTAAGIVNFLASTMRLPGGFASAQDSESVVDGVRTEGGYYLASADQRASLEPPERDEKILAGWNGLAIWGLARAARAGVDGHPLSVAISVASELLDTHLLEDGQLARMSRGGQVAPAAATLEDYGGLALGLVELGCATGESRWLLEARALVEACLSDETFVVPGGGDPTVQSLEAISGDVTEGAMPSGLAMISQAALALHQLTGDDRFFRAAEHSVRPYAEAVTLRPLGFGGLATVLHQIGQGMRELVVVTDDPEDDMSHLARSSAPASWLVAVVTRSQALQLAADGFSLFEGRAEADTSSAYVCQGGVCQLPQTSVEGLRAQLDADN